MSIQRLRSAAGAHRTELLLMLAAVALYLPAIGWGLPQATDAMTTYPWGHDDIAPLGPLAELHNTLVRDGEGGWMAYPLMHYLLLAAAYAPYMLWLLLTGGLGTPSPVFPYGLAAPAEALRVLTIIARVVTVLMAAGTVVAVHHIARTLWDERQAMLAALCVMLLLPMIYYSRTGNLDVPGLFWASLALAAAVRILHDDYTIRRGIWFGILCALAAGTKDSLAGFLLLVIPFVALAHARRSTGRARWAGPVATIVSGGLAYLVTSGFVLSPTRFFSHLAYISGDIPGQLEYAPYPATLAGYADFVAEIALHILNSMGLPMLMAALVGIPVVLRRRPSSALLLVAAVGLLALVVLPTRIVEMRYVLPVSVVLAMFAGAALGAGLAHARAPVRALAGMATVAALALPLARAADLTYAMMRDSRYAAARWLDGRVSAGDRIAFFGPAQKLPRLTTPVRYEHAVTFVGSPGRVRHTPEDVARIVAQVAQEDAPYLLVIPDHSSRAGSPLGSTVPPELYDRLRDGSLGYRPVAHFETVRLLPWARRPELILYYPVVNPPVEIFGRVDALAGGGGS